MKGRFTALVAIVALLFGATSAWAQSDVGDISGRVTDTSGAVLPGVTVTVSSPVLINSLTAITAESGAYQFPRVPIGTYSVKFDLPGFKTLVREDVRITVGFNAQVNAQLEITAVQETVTVTGESPIVDIKNTSNKSTFDLETLQNIPSARDPWVMLERTPAITMDRVNVGGNQSGQQSGYISRGTGTGNNKWYIDGVDITDMSATGASPIYYDFDMLQEMQVTTGGPDASMQTGGVGINLVTRSGTNMFKGSGRLYNTNDAFEADNVTDELRAQGAGSGNPIQNINDFGVEAGGPIMKDKLWFWGSYGRQDIKVGVVNFFLKTPECTPPPPATDTDALRGCLATDQTILNNYNAKLTYAPMTNNKFSFQNTWAEKVRNARDASDLRPLETAYRQKAVDSSFGTFGWETGPSPLWKAGDQHIFSDRLLLDVVWAHLGNNFTLTFQEPAQRDIQRMLDVTSGKFARSYDESIFLRPTNSVDITTSYFLPGALGGDHSFRVGYRYRTAFGQTISHTGGNAEARYQNGLPDAGGTAFRARLYRDGHTQYDLLTHGFYAQDNFTINRLTLNLGVRWDSQKDEALAASVPAHPFAPQVLPALDFPGIDPGITWNNWSPRLGLTYDISGDGRTVARASYAQYFGQMGPGQIASNLLSISQVFVEYPWNDANRDTVVQANEVNFASLTNRSATYDLNNPTNFRGPGSIDPDVKNDRTQEFIVGFDREVANNLAVGASYIWRKYDQFQWQDRTNWTTDNWVAASFTPTSCPNAANGARCETVSYFRPTSQIPGPFMYTNIPDRHRDYNGVELTLNKRYSDRWQASASLAYNDAVDFWDSTAAYEDGSCSIPNLNDRACAPDMPYAPQSAGSGIDNIYTNAKWLVKTNGMYSLPWGGVNAAGSFLIRQGYPFPQGVLTPDRGLGAGQVTIMLDRLGDVRLPNTYTLDLRADRPFQLGKMRLIPSVDVFNVTNAATIQSQRVNQIAANANNVSSIIPPRVVRFGLRATW
jgi:hypothetical protein